MQHQCKDFTIKYKNSKYHLLRRQNKSLLIDNTPCRDTRFVYHLNSHSTGTLHSQQTLYKYLKLMTHMRYGNLNKIYVI